MPAVERPKAKRLRAGKAHRTALLESLPEEQRPIAEQVVLGGLPAVRQAIEKQNAERAAAGDTPIAAGPLLELAEQLVPKVRVAEWRDRAEAAQRDLEVHRSPRPALGGVGRRRGRQGRRDACARAVAARGARHPRRRRAPGVAGRADGHRRRRPHRAGPAPQLAAAEGRRARCRPSWPPRLTEGAGAALTEDAAPERWVAVLDALAFSPVRDKVIPTSLPKELHEDVRSTIARLATRIPKIAHIFEIEPDRNAPRPKTERRKPKKQPPKPKRDPKPKDEPKPRPKPRGRGGADAADQRRRASSRPGAGGAQPERRARSARREPSD